MSKYLIHTIIILIFFSTNNILAQDDCVLKLNEAEKLYENGKIEKIPTLLSGCIESGFDRENKLRALRLLTLVNLFEDNTIKAEKNLLRLLKIDPEYKVNRAVDPVEFIRLFNSFNTSPVFSVGIIGGLNLTKPHLIETFSTNAVKEANPKYSFGGIGISIGIKANYHITKIWDISFEPIFSALSYEVKENVTTSSIVTIAEKMKYIEIPLFCSYYIYNLNNYRFYAEGGLSYNRLMSGTINGQVTYNNNEQANSEPSEILTSHIRKKYNLTGSVGAGAKIDLNRSNLQFSLRYKFGFMNVINPDAKDYDNGDLITKYQFKDNNISINNFNFMISYNREFYIHRKKPNNQTNYDIIRK